MSDWFLPEDERPWTAGNHVVAHIHGAADLLWAERDGEPGSRARRTQTQAVWRRTRLWAYPAYRFFYDPDGWPRGLRGSDRF